MTFTDIPGVISEFTQLESVIFERKQLPYCLRSGLLWDFCDVRWECGPAAWDVMGLLHNQYILLLYNISVLDENRIPNQSHREGYCTFVPLT